MRCRFCNKSISLLRRLNDAEFCSPAHREAFGLEQERALERLVTSPQAVQRSQRLAAAKPGEMEQTGGLMAFLAPAAAGGPAVPAPVVPLQEAAAVHVITREIRFSAGLPVNSGMVGLMATAAPPASVLTPFTGSLAAAAVSIPSRSGSVPGAKARWARSGGTALAQVAPGAAMIPASGRAALTLLSPETQRTRRNHSQRTAGLRAGSRLCPLPTEPCRQRAAPPLHDFEVLPTAGLLRYPVSRIALSRLPDGAKEAAAAVEASWDAFSWTELASPFPCLSYPTPARPASRVFVPGPVIEIAVASSQWTPTRSAAPSAGGFSPVEALIPLTGLSAIDRPSPGRAHPSAASPRPAVRLSRRTDIPAGRSLPSSGDQRTPPALKPVAAKSRVLCDRRPAEAVRQPPAPRHLPQPRRDETSLTKCVPLPVPAAATAAVNALWIHSDPAIAAAGRPVCSGALLLERGSFKISAAEGCQPLDRPTAQARPARPAAKPPAAPVTPLLCLIRAPRRAGSMRDRPARLWPISGLLEGVQSDRRHFVPEEMAAWKPRVSIRPLAVAFDDGKNRGTGPGGVVRFGQEIRDRLSSKALEGAWMKVSRLPSDLKWISMVFPLVLGVWVLARPSTAESLPPAPARQEEAAAEISEARAAALTPVATVPAAPAAANPVPAKDSGTGPAAGGAWERVQSKLSARAAISLTEDFRSGLSQWAGTGEWARSWSYDRSGTVRPGQFAIFQPSLEMRDYVLEMKASVEKRAIQWMVRASGPRNYHFSRLLVTPGTPLTKLEFERWSVVNGRAGRVTRLPLPHAAANQSLYDLRVEVKGENITTYLQGQVIDTMSDSRLTYGGVGLIGTADDRARIYGIHIHHQNDFFGKLCSFLAPRPINGQGSD